MSNQDATVIERRSFTDANNAFIRYATIKRSPESLRHGYLARESPCKKRQLTPDINPGRHMLNKVH